MATTVVVQVDELGSDGCALKGGFGNRLRCANHRHHRAVVIWVGLNIQHLHVGYLFKHRHDSIDHSLPATLTEIWYTLDDLVHTLLS
jgi:hypothetical protein